MCGIFERSEEHVEWHKGGRSLRENVFDRMCTVRLFTDCLRAWCV